MLENMNKGAAPQQTQQNMAESLQRIQTNSNIMMEVGGGEKAGQKEETVEELIKKLQNRGTKVKILGDDDEPVKPTPKQRSGSKKEAVAD